MDPEARSFTLPFFDR